MYVCEKCIEDPCLQEVVHANLISEECDYCGTASEVPIACELDDVLERIRYAIDQEYASPDEETVYDPEEGDYAGTVFDNREMFDDIGFALQNDRLYEDIVSVFWDERFCQVGLLSGAPHERQMDAWNGFKDIVKHHRRYTFLSMSEDDCDHRIIEHPPSRMMENIARTLKHFDLIKHLGPETRIWRVRVHDKTKVLSIPVDIASPSAKQAIYANRMSAAGVSMFYGADECETAWLETVDPNRLAGRMVTGGQFIGTCLLNILDLCSLPIQESLFSDWDQFTRESFRFLREFRGDLSQPVTKYDRQHIDYVPTQVFTEFIRFELRTRTDEQIHGIRYPSSKNGKGCYVIFADQDECLPDVQFRRHPQILRYVDGSVRTLTKFEEIAAG